MITKFRIDAKSSSKGELLVCEHYRRLGFVAKRFYVLKNIPKGVIRGKHAHKQLSQVFVCLQGSLDIRIEDCSVSETVHLTEGDALHITPGYWRELSNFMDEAICLVLADEPYDPDDYLFNKKDIS